MLSHSVLLPSAKNEKIALPSFLHVSAIWGFNSIKDTESLQWGDPNIVSLLYEQGEP